MFRELTFFEMQIFILCFYLLPEKIMLKNPININIFIDTFFYLCYHRTVIIIILGNYLFFGKKQCLGGEKMEFLNSLRDYGCDVEGGLNRMRGKVDFYKRLIAKFPEVIEENEFASYIKSGEIDKAIAHSHLIKGVTANLSFETLYQSYTKIVDLLRANRPNDALSEFEKIRELQENLVNYIKNNINE